MTLDDKFAAICFSIAGLVLLWIFIITALRWLIFHIAARAVHDFHVLATGSPPKCGTCPFNRKCMYSNGIVCHFEARHAKFKWLHR